jgi:hypothetical protein
MADATKGWHAVFDKGSKQAQEKLKKAHGHKPEFQAFLKSRGIEGGERSAKQATTSLTKATDTKIAAQKIADMRFKKALQASSDRVREMGRRRRESGEGLGGGLETAKDVVAHIKKYGSIKAGRLGEETMKNEEVDQIDEVTKKEAEAMLGGPVKGKPKMPPGKQPAGYRYVRGLARRAMKAGMKTEEVEQVDELTAYKRQGVPARPGFQVDRFVDRDTKLGARKAETGSSTRIPSGDVLGRKGSHETSKQAVARRVGKDSYGLKFGGKTSHYNRTPKPNLPEEVEQVDEAKVTRSISLKCIS